jgi:meprin B
MFNRVRARSNERRFATDGVHLLGREHNFNKYTLQTTDTLELPYDYNSVMHYSKTAFSINGLPTIITKDPNAFIGQRNTLSANDIEEIRRYYKCT